MANIIVKESQLITLKNSELDKYIQFKTKWGALNEEEKKAAIQYSNIINKRKDNINEGNWMNTVGDVVGIFDPTGVVDLVNGVSYFYQGDNLFGTLSLVSAVPYLGDAIAKPILLGGKMTSSGLKGLRTAMNGGKASEIALAAEKAGGQAKKLVRTADEWAPKVMGMLKKGKRVPLIGRMFRRIEEFMQIMFQASKDMKLGKTAGKGILPRSAFRNYGVDTSKNVLMRMFQRGGFIKNTALSTLLYKSKVWLGFLDFIGVGNFVGPEEFESEYGEEYTKEGMKAYLSTEEGNKWYQEEFGDTGSDGTEKSLGTEVNDPMSSFINTLINGPEAS